MEAPLAVDLETDRVENEGRKASWALQRALADAWVVTSVRDQRKCDHPLLPAEMPASILAKVARILQERGVREKEPVEPADPKAPWHQQLEQHVARLMQQMRAQPQQFRQLLLMAAAESGADCVVNQSSSRGFVDSRSAYRRLRRAAMALGEEIFYTVRAFVRRSETNGVLPQDAQVTRLTSLYKLELRRHVTISAVIECIQQADTDPSASATKPGFSIVKRGPNKHHLLRRQVKSAGVTSSNPAELSTRAVSAPAGAVRRKTQLQQVPESGSTPDKIKTVHAFKLQALERLLAKTWQGDLAPTLRSLQSVPVNPAQLSDETLSQIQERVTAFLYHRSRENYPLWSEPPFSREETSRHLRTLVATFMTTPLLQGLTIDQLLELAKAARWQTVALDDALCTRNMEIDALIVVMDGSFISSTPTDSTSGPSSPPRVVISAPACLGELGMVRNSERWPRTLTAQSEDGVKVLTLSKLTFEALLHRFFNIGKAIPPALASAASLLQPRRPSSSPAVAARRLALSFRGSMSGRRPSTAAPFAEMETNIARWHQVRDEKLRDYHAGLEAEQRAAALEALQKAMAELSSASSADDDSGFSDYLTSTRSPRKSSWSRHGLYPSFIPVSSSMDNANQVKESLFEVHSTNSSSIETVHTDSSSTEFADQLREFYRTLNARRSVLKARLASSVTSDQMVQQFAERRSSAAGASDTVTDTTTTTTTTTEITWWADEEEENWGLPSEDEIEMVLDDDVGSASGPSSPFRDRLGGASFSSQVSSRSPASSPLKEDRELPSPLKSPVKLAASPSREPQQENNTGSTITEDTDVGWLTGKETARVPESNESQREGSPVSELKNQSEDGKAATSTRRKSALNMMLTRQSTATMARHSKLLDAETAQRVLIEKHFADTSVLRGGSSRPQSGRHQSAGSVAQELHQSHSHAPLPLRADLQRRMDSMLNQLQLPPKNKLDLVLKYTHVDYYDLFPIAVQLWERVHEVVTRRESVMNSLWEFEMLASDPRRHFRTISTQRLREEKERDALFSQLNKASKACIDVMDNLLQSCGDIVSFGDRPYREKMKRDYTELLYEVEQERLGVIYNGVRPHVAPAVDECDEPERDEDESLPGRPSSGRKLINVRVPSAVKIPSSLAPRRPFNSKDGNSPRVSGKEVNLSPDNQNPESATDAPEFAVDGTNAEPTSARYQLATPRESIFVPVTILEPSTNEPENHISRVSRVTVQVQKQRRAELAALNKQLDTKAYSMSLSEARPPEKTYTVPAKDAKKSASRMKQQEERASLRELFQQFITSSR